MKRRLTGFMLAAVATILIGTTTVSAATSAALSRQRLIVDGKTAACELYAIDGSNYIKLRDLAYVLNGTGSQFSVERDEKSTMVSISTGKAYVADGNELSAAIPSYPPTIAKRMPTIQIDGNSVTDLSVYSIGSHDFFKLRELGGLLGFSVDYDAPSDAVIVKSMTTVYVSSAAELLNAIASNTRVVLSAGTYNLSSVNLPAVKNSHITWKTVFDGTEVFVNGVRSCIVSSAAGAASTQVVVEPRYANVLNFSGCSGIKLVNLTVGHTLEPGYCTGGVLHFSDSENVGISSCVLYGCGTYGLILEDVRGLTVRDTEIKECTYGIMTAASSSSLFFLNSRFHDCEGYTMMTLDNCKKAVFDGCIIKDNSSDTGYDSLVFLSVCDTVAFRNCTISGNTIDSMLKVFNSSAVTFDHSAIQNNTFTSGIYAKGSDKSVVISPEPQM